MFQKNEDISIYTFVEATLHENGILGIDNTQRAVGTLRVAGFGEKLSAKDTELAKKIILQEVGPALRTASVTANADTIEKSVDTADKFMEIDALIKSNTCPRCRSSMVPIKLSSYKAANFCPNCRSTLWQNAKK